MVGSVVGVGMVEEGVVKGVVGVGVVEEGVVIGGSAG